MADDKPIIVIKKKGGHGGHHGGAWKVAYADFVTAMMAFFMVMWLVNSAETKTKSAIASYFRRPGLFESGSGTPLLIGGAGILTDAYAPAKPDPQPNTEVGADGKEPHVKGLDGDKRGPFSERQTDQQMTSEGIVQTEQVRQGVKIKEPKEGGAVQYSEQLTMQKKRLEELARALESKIKDMPEFKELLGLIEVKVDAEGLTIEIMDTDKASMFRSGSAQINPTSIPAFEKISSLLKAVPNKIDIMGHTDGKPFASRLGMSNWELSADRANAARRVLEQQGVPAERITSVVGRADRELHFPEDPFNPSNRRISIKVKFDLEKISANPQEAAALQEFKEIFPETMKDPTPTAGSADTPNAGTATSEILPEQKTPVPDKSSDPNEAYAPKFAIVGKDQKNTITLPPEESGPERAGASSQSGSSQRIFKDDPVVGPINPFFNQ